MQVTPLATAGFRVRAQHLFLARQLVLQTVLTIVLAIRSSILVITPLPLVVVVRHYVQGVVVWHLFAATVLSKRVNSAMEAPAGKPV